MPPYTLMISLMLSDAPPGPKEKAWDVTEPPGPSEAITFDVRTGTWLSLDLSPDGREIVFDLLGDLYVLPIAGGDARSMTGGVAWDMQPAWSPSGEKIAFTSDRGGGDNLWIMDKDGNSPVAVTNEKHRLVTSPVWLSDDYLAGRKHFTAERSLGAGEIWLYHRSGGSGTALTTKTSDQKDLGEPAFSPDGRSLYFSQDASPGGNFEYNKDPNGQIYVIGRKDLKTGELDVLVGGPGGAARPTPSPDGRWLAFVRRLEGLTTLCVRDLESGEERAITEPGALERDMQETWAIHGVYPAMSFTPDSRAVVYWARGELRRVSIDADAVPATIPFRVSDSRRVTPALRFPVAVAPKDVTVKAMSGLRSSPSGDEAVFAAVGQLWRTAATADGSPRRLTDENERLELGAVWSRDGKSLAFSTWDDEALGDLRVLSAGKARVVVAGPGHFSEPAFSPDGGWLVFRRGGAGWLRAGAWSDEPGIYRVCLERCGKGGSAPELLLKEGEQPHFGASGDRLYFFGRQGKKTALKSIDLGREGPITKQPFTHLAFDKADQAVVSPDDRFVAFSERNRGYVTVLPATGGSRDVGPKSDDLPLARFAAETAEGLHFVAAGDDLRVAWSRGAALETVRLKDVFEWLPGAPKPKPDPLPVQSIPITLTLPADVPRGAVAFEHARVISMRGVEVLEDTTVVVEGNRITAVGPSTGTTVPAGAVRIDATGKTLLPGFIDVHAHGAQAEDGIPPEQSWIAQAHLAFGVTTIHDPSNDSLAVFLAAERQRTGRLLAPRIFSTGTILYGADLAIKSEIDSLADAKNHVSRQRALGAISVKSYNQPRRDQRQQVIAAARELGMMVVPEGGSTFQHNLTQVVDGHTGIEHAVPVEAIYDDVLALWTKTAVGWTPTFNVAYGGLMGENYWYGHGEVWKHPRLRRFVPPRVLDQASRRRQLVPDEEYNHVAVARIAKRFIDAGGRVLVGAHGQREGLGAHWEIWSLAQGGCTPLEALRAATLHGAWYLGMEKDLGSVETGKLADLLLLDGDPLSDIRQTDTISHVVLNGRVYRADTLDEIAPDAVKRARLHFEGRPGATLGTSVDGHGHGDED